MYVHVQLINRVHVLGMQSEPLGPALIGRAGASPPSRTTGARCLYKDGQSVVQIPYSSKCFYVNLFKRHGHKMRPYRIMLMRIPLACTTRVQLCMCMITMAAVCLRRTVYFADAWDKIEIRW